MQCRNHPAEIGVNTCNQCGSWLCEKCSFERGGRIFCPNCATQQAGAETPMPTHSGTKVTKLWGLLFLFSVVIPLPGLGYMYLGLIKRGLVAMTAFFATIYMSTLSMIFIFAIPVLILACIFDGFRLLNRINAGEIVNDNADDVINFLRRNRALCIGLLLLILAINVVGAIMPILRNLIPVLLVIWAGYVLFGKSK